MYRSPTLSTGYFLGIKRVRCHMRIRRIASDGVWRRTRNDAVVLA